MALSAPVLTKLVPRDSAISVYWSFDSQSVSVTDQVMLSVYDTVLDTYSQVYISDISTGKFRVNNLINNHEYILLLIQYLDDGSELDSNTLHSAPVGAPDCNVEIVSITSVESPDSVFVVTVQYRLFDLLYNDAKITKVNLVFVDENTKTMFSHFVSVDSLAKNLDGSIAEFQSYVLNNQVNGDYSLIMSLSNLYGSSPTTTPSLFSVRDLPNQVTNLSVISGQDSAASVSFSCVESVALGFHIVEFIISYYDVNDSGNVFTKVISNVAGDGSLLYAPGDTINIETVVDNLSNGVTYSFSVVASNVRGLGDASSSVSACPGVGTEIVNVQLDYVTESVLQASWTVVQNSFNISQLNYEIRSQKTDVLLLSGSTVVNALDLSNLSLSEGTEIYLKLIPTFEVPDGFIPSVGTVSGTSWTYDDSVRTSSPKVVFSKSNVVFATSGVSDKTITLVASAVKTETGALSESQITSILFSIKEKTSDVWVNVGEVTSDAFSIDGSIVTATLDASNIDAGMYDVGAKAVYGGFYGPFTGTLGKVTSLELPEISSVTMVSLSQSAVRTQLNLTTSSKPDKVIVQLYSNASFTTLIAEQTFSQASDNIYEISGLSLSTNAKVYIKVTLFRSIVDTEYYVTYLDAGAPVAPLVSDSFILYDQYSSDTAFLSAIKGTIVELYSGGAADLSNHGLFSFELVASFPSANWGYVDKVIVQTQYLTDSGFTEWVTSKEVSASAATSLSAGVYKITTKIPFNKGPTYRVRSFTVGKNIATPEIPAFIESDYSPAVIGYSTRPISTLTATSNIDENDEANCLVNVSGSWNIADVATFPDKADFELSIDSVKIYEDLKHVSRDFSYSLSASAIATTLGLSFSNSKEAAELLRNKTIRVKATPTTALADISSYTFVPPLGHEIVGGYTYYSGRAYAYVSPYTTPNAPAALRLKTLDVEYCIFEWDKSVVTSYHPLTKYILQVSTSSLFDTIAYSAEILKDNTLLSVQTATVTGLTKDTEYFARICANNSYGSSPFVNCDSFTTLGVVPTMGTITVSQNTTDEIPLCNVSFAQLAPVNYIVDSYTMTVYKVRPDDSRVIVDIISIPNNNSDVSYDYLAEFAQTFVFSVVANMSNVLGSTFVSFASESQSIVPCDKPSIISIIWSKQGNNNSTVNIEVDAHGSDLHSLVLLALAKNTDLHINPVSSPSMPEQALNGNYFYTIDLEYEVDDSPKFILFVSNLKGSNYSVNNL